MSLSFVWQYCLCVQVEQVVCEGGSVCYVLGYDLMLL